MTIKPIPGADQPLTLDAIRERDRWADRVPAEGGITSAQRAMDRRWLLAEVDRLRAIEASFVAVHSHRVGDASPETAAPCGEPGASLEARAEALRALWWRTKWIDAPLPEWAGCVASEKRAWLAVVRAVDASRPAAPEVDDDEPLTRGTRVRTVAHLTALFAPSLHPHRRSNALGKIVRRMTSGDIYYDVRHDDGTVAGYERSELIDLTADASRPGLTEEQARLDFETACREARARGGAYCITKLGEALSTLDAALRASRGETGPAPDPRATPHAGDPASLADVVAASAREPHADVVLHALHVSGGAAAIGVQTVDTSGHDCKPTPREP